MTHEQQLTPISIGFLGTPSPTGEMPVLARQTEFAGCLRGGKAVGMVNLVSDRHKLRRSVRVSRGSICEEPFSCPHCNALHNVVRKEAGAAMITRQATCRACGGPLPAREVKFALSYLLLRTAIKTDPRARGHFQRARRPLP
jgi:hypothetical protein